MLSLLRGVVQRFAVCTEVIKANKSSKLVVYPAIFMGGSASTAATYYFWKVNYNDPSTLEQQQEEEGFDFEAWETEEMMKIYKAILHLFPPTNGKSLFEILHPHLYPHDEQDQD